ncbi:Alkylated DNA repair alkB like 8 [Fusarium agapanthi]|uniref:Alkylated DNA repair alkB like 8 n=1 Tax=Fusarium agapanthi TaxID=1803897 RepID=A0A9P5BEM2_9HYPO|nr:Alkylated DNA repair alkB like 8 [Fusarium agapanthi]
MGQIGQVARYLKVSLRSTATFWSTVAVYTASPGSIIDVSFDAFNQATPLFSEYDYELFEEDCRQRAYIIDRDLSLLTGEPYLMQEDHTDPSVTDLSEEDGGILYNKGTSLRFEIFKFRARLATIQGKIFDLVYSVRADKLSFDQRETVADRLEEMLGKWVDWIPEPFRGDTVPGFDYVQLSRYMTFRWSCTHATQAAMTVLAANNLTLSEHDLHDSIDKYQQRLHIAHGEVSGRLSEDPTGSIEQSFNTCGELIIKALDTRMEELPIKPSGIFMQHDFITPEHEQKLTHIFENELEWPSRGGRLSLHYGYTFSYKTFGIDEETPFKPFPDWLVPLLPTTEGRPPDQVCLQQYAPGTGIPPHVDTHGPFDQLYSLSLGSPLFMQFANKETGEKIEVDLLPRSMMQMSGDSRLHWTHGIKSRKTDTLPDGTVRLRQIRWSLTYRWIREGAECECGNEKLCDTAQRRNGIEREYRWKQYEQDAKAPQS